MRELLRQSVAEAEADVAFVALLDSRGEGKRATLEIPAVFPLAERSAQLITRWVRKGVCRAIEVGRTELMVGKISSGGDRRRSTKMLVVVPMYTSSGSAWGAVAMVRESSVVDWELLQAVQQCACTITMILTQSDDPLAYSTFANSRPQVSRLRVQSVPRNDFLLHELRVPLSAATYALDALAQHHGPNWDYDDEHQLHTAQSGVAEAQRIIRSVSQWPALGNGAVAPHLEAVAVDEVLARALTLFPAARYKVVQHLDSHLPAIWGDESWITQVLVNLLENALKYSNSRRNIEVAAYQSDDDFVLVSVRSWSKVLPVNRGYYTREGEQRRLTHDSTSKGLGLNIARYFITSLGGELWIEGDGTEEVVVTLALPIVASHTGQPVCKVPIKEPPSHTARHCG